MKKNKFNFPVYLTILLTVILLAIFLLIGYIWKVLTTSEFFSVKQVIVRGANLSFDSLKEKNIFLIKADGLSRSVYFNYPDCRLVRFSKILPDTIIVDFLKRRPVALVKFYKNFAIDEEGYLFYPAPDIDLTQIPVIYGLETKIFAPKAGTKYGQPEVRLALDIIKEVKTNNFFRNFLLKRIDITNIESAGFFIILPIPVSPGIEVRLAAGNIKQKIMILAGLLTQARSDWPNIKYIDLRFKEPLIKLNNVK